MDKLIKRIAQEENYKLSDDEISRLTEKYLKEIKQENYNFENVNKEKFTTQRKKRDIYTFDKDSVEYILTRYLKVKLDNIFNIKYVSRNKIINTLFNTLPVINDLNDFVIIRADFKSFFDSVLTEHVYEEYIKNSELKRVDKRIIKKYTEKFKFCYAGLCLSNSLTEIVCRNFDKKLRAILDRYGVVYCERYVDDILIILNSYISEVDIMDIFEDTIKEVFGDSPVKLNREKYLYIARREIIDNKRFDFLGYSFTILKKDKKLEMKFGIADAKIKKYSNRYKNIFLDYKRNNNVELLRQRLKIQSSRTIVTKRINKKSFKWMTKGIVANYNELRYYIDNLEENTEEFFKNIFFNIMNDLNINIPYFLKNSNNEESIYNIFSSLKRNRSMIFEKNIGIKRKDLIKNIHKLDKTYQPGNKNYNIIVVDYFEIVNMK